MTWSLVYLFGVVGCRFFVFFVSKQKTPYEMRISDWSSDVCSSDLAMVIGDQITMAFENEAKGWRIVVDQHQMENAILNLCVNARDAMDGRGRSDERRVGKACVRT